LLSFAAKWLDGKEIIYADQSKRRNIEDDTHLLRQIHGLLDDAWLVIAQNGDGFDLPKIRSRMIIKGMKPPSSFRTIDTLKVAKKQFGFTSNKLAHLSDVLGCTVRKDKHPEFPGFELWRECIKRNPRAWKVMKRYNIDDVLTLEEVYLKMRPWIERHPNVGVFDPKSRHVCPKCGGEVQSRGFRMTQVQQFRQYQCKKCHGWSWLRIGDFDKQQRQVQLGN
jgi:hypothetical protein